jgi:uncharacterized protein YdeI (YjbR/CyaY-like superfamily)
MPERIQFESRDIFRQWLQTNCLRSKGVWLVFGKTGGPKTIKANEALEEALCFGWIDGQMQSIDEKTYIKYFSMRSKKSKWSEKNKAIANDLINQGLMTEYGYAKIEDAKRNGIWDVTPPAKISDAEIEILIDKLRDYEPAFSNFMAMSPSVKKIYAGLYLDAKSEETKRKRLEKIILRLNQNLKPM